MSDIAYVYGEHNGGSYVKEAQNSNEKDEERTHWDPRISVQSVAGTVQVGVVPPSVSRSTSSDGVWVNEDGQFLSLSRDGLSRLITFLQEAGRETYGVNPW